MINLYHTWEDLDPSENFRLFIDLILIMIDPLQILTLIISPNSLVPIRNIDQIIFLIIQNLADRCSKVELVPDRIFILKLFVNCLWLRKQYSSGDIRGRWTATRHTFRMEIWGCKWIIRRAGLRSSYALFSNLYYALMPNKLITQIKLSKQQLI